MRFPASTITQAWTRRPRCSSSASASASAAAPSSSSSTGGRAAAASSASRFASVAFRNSDSSGLRGGITYLGSSSSAAAAAASAFFAASACALWSHCVIARGAYPATTYAS